MKVQILILSFVISLVNPINWNPLMLVTELIQSFNHFSKGFIEIFVNYNHIEVFFVFSL